MYRVCYLMCELISISILSLMFLLIFFHINLVIRKLLSIISPTLFFYIGSLEISTATPHCYTIHTNELGVTAIAFVWSAMMATPLPDALLPHPIVVKLFNPVEFILPEAVFPFILTGT